MPMNHRSKFSFKEETKKFLYVRFGMTLVFRIGDLGKGKLKFRRMFYVGH